IPSIPARKASARSSASSRSLPSTTLPISRNMVPYSGPAAPPTFPMSAIATALKTPAMSSGGLASRRSRAALKPRLMFMPWSASPMAESSSVRYSFCSSIREAASRSQTSTSSRPTESTSRSPTQAGRLHGGVPQLRQLVVELEQGDRDALHLEGRDVGADQVASDGHAATFEEPVEVPIHDVQLDERRPSHRVDESEDVVAGSDDTVFEDRPGQDLHDLGRALDLHPLPARLPVDADADLHLIVAGLEGGLARRRNGARRQCHSHRPGLIVHLPAQIGDLGQRPALFGRGPADLLGEHGGTHTAAPRRVEAVLDGDVVVDHDRLHFDAFFTGQV